MGNILNIGARALLVNQRMLETVGHNIANVNTPGYSRQSVTLGSVGGQYSGSGYYGNGVEITDLKRNYSDFLTKQASLMKSVAASDSSRYEKLQQLEGVFTTGADGLGASVNDMLNAYADVVSAPSDLTARSVVMVRTDEMAARFRTAQDQIRDLRLSVREQLGINIDKINDKADQIAKINEEITRSLGSGRQPNDLLDQRDQLISELNQYVKTSSVETSNGGFNLYIEGRQPLVLGTSTVQVSLTDAGYLPDNSQVRIKLGSGSVLDGTSLGGGELAGLMRFMNQDLADAENMLGRMALTIGTQVNQQQGLGIDLNGQKGKDLLTVATPSSYASSSNTSSATLSTTVSDSTKLVPTDYQLNFLSATSVEITRLRDGTKVTGSPITFTAGSPIDFGEGLSLSFGAVSAAQPQTGDSFLVRPYDLAAGNIATKFTSPRELAMANPLVATPSVTNTGTVSVTSLTNYAVPSSSPPTDFDATLTFSVVGSTITYSSSAASPSSGTYVPGQAIVFSSGSPSTDKWSLVLNGVPGDGDTLKVEYNKNPRLSAGNAEAMLALRDAKVFDGGSLSDGYASVISEIGIKVQGAKSASAVSADIAANVEQERTSVSGVNLDEEAARMLQYQQAYQASGKMMQLAQSIFETLLQSMAR